MRDIFIAPERDEAFASISKDLINNDDIRYIFPMDKKSFTCYKVNRTELLKLIKDAVFDYDFYNTICFEKYKDYFRKISVHYAQHLVS